MDPTVLANAQILWDYNRLHQPIARADCLFVFGGPDIRVPAYAAEVALQYAFTQVLCSGGLAHQGEIIDTGWGRPEADVFAEVMVDHGVPDSIILRERHAQNTGQNVTLSRALLDVKNIPIKSGLIVHKPFMERRSLATAQKQWPNINWSVTSPDLSLEAYLEGQDVDKILHPLVGDTARMELYAAQGFQTPQPMSEKVKTALQHLIDLGYTKYLPKV